MEEKKGPGKFREWFCHFLATLKLNLEVTEEQEEEAMAARAWAGVMEDAEEVFDLVAKLDGNIGGMSKTELLAVYPDGKQPPIPCRPIDIPLLV
jgi:hypothetical protein